jgi:hypothetical protein
MAVLLLISEQEVKDLTSISENVDVSKFRHHIQSAQDIYIKPAISETCYDALLDSVENDNPTALETVLLDGDGRSFAGLKIALAWWVLWLAYPSLIYSIGGATVSKKTGDKFEAISESELNMLMKIAERTATSYTDYLIKYIKKHSDDYTCYSCEGITPVVDGSESLGIALDNDKIVRFTEEQETLRRS